MKKPALTKSEMNTIDAMLLGGAGDALIKFLRTVEDDLKEAAIDTIKGGTTEDALKGQAELMKAQGVIEVIDLLNAMLSGLKKRQRVSDSDSE